jgi:hypothetical protein
MAVVIGPAINEQADYTVTSKWVAQANYTVAAGAGAASYVGTYQYTYPYGKNTNTFFNDIVNTLGNQTQLIALAGQSRTVQYNGGTYYVYISSAARVSTNLALQTWTPRSGIYTVPTGQGTTAFAFVTIRSWQGAAGGNYLDNIVFQSGSEPAKDDTITYVGNTSLFTTTKAGYAYALAEVRGSTVINLTGLSAAFNSTATTPNASLGTGSWYTPNAAGTLTFTGLTPGKNCRVIGIPVGSINAALNTNMSPADVLDDGYFTEAIMVSAGSGTATTMPSVTYEYAGGGAGTVTASLAYARRDVEYALLADDGSGGSGAAGKPVITGPALSTTDWARGTGDSLEFSGLDPDTRYFLIARPVGYIEVGYAQAAINTDGTTAALPLKTPVSTAVDVTPSDITTAPDGSSISVDTKSGYIYRLVDPVTGDVVAEITGDGTTKTFTGYDPNKTYQVVARAPSDTSWMRGVRLFPYPGELVIDFAGEGISDTGTAGGTVPSGVQYTIQNFDNTYLAGDTTSWMQATGTSSIDLGAAAAGTATSILDSIPSSPAQSATLTYRQSGGEGTYTGASLHPTRTLTIPARPAAPAQPTDYFINYPAETLDAKADSLQLAPAGTTAWTDIAPGTSAGFIPLGWGEAADYAVDVRTKCIVGATPATSAFASRIASNTIVARPAAPRFTAVYTVGTPPAPGTLVVTMTGHTSGTDYQYRQGAGGWMTDASLDSTGVSSAWPFDDDADDYETRLAATADAPASYVATVSAPIIIDPVNMNSYPWGDAAATDPFDVIITNISSAPVDDVTLTLTDTTYFTLTGTSPFDVPANGTYTGYKVAARPGLDAGTYRTSLEASYEVGGTGSGKIEKTRAEVSITIEKVHWDISAMVLSTSLVTDTSLVLDVTGAPQTSLLDWRAGAAAWQGPSAAIDASGLFSAPFVGLSPSSTYVLSVKALADTNHYESGIVQVNAYTAWATPVWSDVLFIDYREEVLRFHDG